MRGAWSHQGRLGMKASSRRLEHKRERERERVRPMALLHLHLHHASCIMHLHHAYMHMEHKREAEAEAEARGGYSTSGSTSGSNDAPIHATQVSFATLRERGCTAEPRQTPHLLCTGVARQPPDPASPAQRWLNAHEIHPRRTCLWTLPPRLASPTW